LNPPPHPAAIYNPPTFATQPPRIPYPPKISLPSQPRRLQKKKLASRPNQDVTPQKLIFVPTKTSLN
jgi:hypothetical protein